MAHKKARFCIWINEGAFFHEPWLTDNKTKKDYRYDKIPPKVLVEVILECQERGTANPEIACIIFDFALKMAKRESRVKTK